MRGIKVKGGAAFVEIGTHTYKYTQRKGWGVSPILLSSLEWDMRTEGPDAFLYLTEGDIRALPDFEKLSALYKKDCARFKEEPEEL